MRRYGVCFVAVIVIVQMVLLGLCCMLMPTALHAMPRVPSTDATGCCAPITESGIRAIAGETVCVVRSEHPLFAYRDVQPLRSDLITVGFPAEPADGAHVQAHPAFVQITPAIVTTETPVTHIHFLC